MSGNTASGIGNGAGNYPLRIAVLGVEKLRRAKRFDDEHRRDEPGAHSQRNNEEPKIASQFETVHAPDWNGTRLNSVFVAQVLGQILNKDEHLSRSNPEAYAEQGPILALFCDARA